MKLKLNKTYLKIFIVLLILEIAIATFLSAGFLRSTFGDFLVVMLMYCFVKSMFNIKPLYVALGVLIFACIVEFLQLFQFSKALNLQNNKVVTTILGNTFQIGDLIAYTLGCITILIVEYKIRHLNQKTHSKN